MSEDMYEEWKRKTKRKKKEEKDVKVMRVLSKAKIIVLYNLPMLKKAKSYE